MRRAADLYPGEAKTDKRDAFVIADTGRTRRKQVHWLDVGSDELLERLRVLNGFDIDLAADQTRLTNRCRDALTSVSPALERAVGARLHQAGVRDLLAKYPTLSALRSAGRARITRTVKARSSRLATKIVDAVIAALNAQTVTVPAETTIGRVIAELAVELDRVFARRDALAIEIEEAFLAHPFGELLSSMPGIGPRTGSRILAEIGDGTRFADGDKLASYAGLAPVTRQSGKSINGESKADEATTGSKTPCSSPPSPPCGPPTPKRVKGQWDLPGGGQEISPLMATRFPQWRPSVVGVVVRRGA
jgi:transposase